MICIKTAEGWRPLIKVCSNSNDVKGVFRNLDYDTVVIENAARAERFCFELEHNPRGRFAEPLYGAYGEKL